MINWTNKRPGGNYEQNVPPLRVVEYLLCPFGGLRQGGVCILKMEPARIVISSPLPTNGEESNHFWGDEKEMEFVRRAVSAYVGMRPQLTVLCPFPLPVDEPAVEWIGNDDVKAKVAILAAAKIRPSLTLLRWSVGDLVAAIELSWSEGVPIEDII